MPSSIRGFQFRNPQLRKKLDSKGIDGNKLMKLLSKHLEDSLESETCPICGKSFDDCEYFHNWRMKNNRTQINFPILLTRV